jgi:hypothetical protein
MEVAEGQGFYAQAKMPGLYFQGLPGQLTQGLAEAGDEAVEAAVGHDQDDVAGLDVNQEVSQEGIGVREIPGQAAGPGEVGHELGRGKAVVLRGLPDIGGLTHEDQDGPG